MTLRVLDKKSKKKKKKTEEVDKNERHPRTLKIGMKERSEDLKFQANTNKRDGPYKKESVVVPNEEVN